MMGRQRKSGMSRGAVRSLYCQRWPDCMCGDQWKAWSVTLSLWVDPAQAAPTPTQCEEAAFLIYVMLSCVSENCPDPRFRAKAASELRARVFDRQRTIATDRALH